jgi:hypothetical protein
MKLKMVVTAAMVVAATAMTTSPALAANKPELVPTSIQTRGIDKTYLNATSGDWAHCTYVTKAKYTQTAACSKGVSVTESISGNIGYDAHEISAAVGFSVTFSQSVSSSNSVTIRRGGYGWYDVGFRYKRYKIGMETRTCAIHCTNWSKPDWVTVQQHTGNTYHYFGTGAE